jgi:hypothetical protein
MQIALDAGDVVQLSDARYARFKLNRERFEWRDGALVRKRQV